MTPVSNPPFPKGKFSGFVSGKPDLMKEINPKYNNSKNQQKLGIKQKDDYEENYDEEDEIINIKVNNGNSKKIKAYPAGNKNYESIEARQKASGQYRPDWSGRGNVPGGQDTLSALSDIKGATISNESDFNIGQLGGTISSLVNTMNNPKGIFKPDMYLNERMRMLRNDPIQQLDLVPYESNETDEKHRQALYPSHYSSGNQTAYFNNDADLRMKYQNANHFKISFEENVEDDEVLGNDEIDRRNALHSPVRNNKTELFQIQEEIPYSSSSVLSEKRTETQRTKYNKNSSILTSNYYSLASHSENLNENFLLWFLMTPRLLRLFTEDGIYLPYIFRLSPGIKMAKQFVEHYVFEFLEPESLTQVGTIDLIEVKEVLTDDRFK